LSTGGELENKNGWGAQGIGGRASGHSASDEWREGCQRSIDHPGDGGGGGWRKERAEIVRG